MTDLPTIDPMSDHVLALITVGESEEATSIARRLVEAKLAAGVQMIPIGSIYHWDEEIVEDNEVLLIAKTKADKFDSVRELVVELHSYEVPPILRIDIAEAHLPYLKWIDQTVGGSTTG